jgi:hypothetical protein
MRSAALAARSVAKGRVTILLYTDNPEVIHTKEKAFGLTAGWITGFQATFAETGTARLKLA